MNDTKKIIVPIDFLQYTNSLVEYSTHIAGEFGADISFLHVIEGVDLYGDYLGPTIKHLSPEMEMQAKSKMEALTSGVALLGVQCKGKTISGDVVESILEYTAKENGDMIIVATHGRKGLEKLWLGSVAEQLIRSAPCPVLSYTPK